MMLNFGAQVKINKVYAWISLEYFLNYHLIQGGIARQAFNNLCFKWKLQISYVK